MTPERLAEIRARVEAATPGPWRGELEEISGRDDSPDLRLRWLTHDSPWWEGYEGSRRAENDGTFIASREDIPALLAYIAELEAKIAAK